ncbi:hypothetical protein AN220_28775, partial [Streptomyces nanshensis]
MTPEGRRGSRYGRLLRHGFTDPESATRLLEAPTLATVRDDALFLDALGATADPDLALVGLVRLIEALEAVDKDAQPLLDTLLRAKP